MVQLYAIKISIQYIQCILGILYGIGIQVPTDVIFPSLSAGVANHAPKISNSLLIFISRLHRPTTLLKSGVQEGKDSWVKLLLRWSVIMKTCRLLVLYESWLAMPDVVIQFVCNCGRLLKVGVIHLPRHLYRPWLIQARIAKVMRSPKLAAMGVATLSGLMPVFFEPTMTPTMMIPEHDMRRVEHFGH